MNIEKAMSYDGPFYLLLRPFRAATYQEIWDLRNRFLSPDERLELEGFVEPTVLYPLLTKIGIAIEGKAIIVTLGWVEGSHEASHVILPLYPRDADWRRLVTILAEHSQGIILLPETSEGILEELRLLVESSYYKKTIVIMPPLSDKVNADIYGQSTNDWLRLRQGLLLNHGYNLPVAIDTGLAFTVDSNFSCREKVRLNKSEKDWGLTNALDILTSDLKSEWLPLKDFYASVEPLLLNSREIFWQNLRAYFFLFLISLPLLATLFLGWLFGLIK